MRYLEYSQKMDKKSTKIIDSNLRHVTKALHVPIRDMCSKFEFAIHELKCSKIQNAPKEVLLQNSEMLENEIKTRQK